jgi:DNA-binding CsgD family transcriptional regulator
MSARRIRDRLAHVTTAAELLCDTNKLLELAVQALIAACPHGAALAFTRRGDGTPGPAATWIDGGPIPLRALRSGGPVPWIVDLERVPIWQRDTWVEPMHAGVHGPDYFSSTHPVRNLIGPTAQPDYARMMVCQNGRMIAWTGIYVDGKRGFRASERTALAVPLRIAAALDSRVPRITLAPRQHDIVSRVALGWTSKRIVRELDLSPATVKTVLERLFRYTGTDNRTALIDWWRCAN